jgi:hypothetical protein
LGIGLALLEGGVKGKLDAAAIHVEPVKHVVIGAAASGFAVGYALCDLFCG